MIEAGPFRPSLFLYNVAMTHQLNLCPGPFKAITSGRKDVEMRLNDEKRQAIKPNDIIEFTNLETKEKISVKVISLHPFKDFSEVYATFPKKRLGYRFFERAKPSDMLKYYPQEKIDKYGALAIVIELLPKD